MNFENYTDRSKGFIQSAQSLAVRLGHQKFAPEHILKVLLDDKEGLAANLMSAAGADPKKALSLVEDELAKTPSVEGSGAGQLYIAQETARLFDEVSSLAEKASDKFVTSERLLLGLCLTKGGSTGDILKKSGLTPEGLNKAINDIRKGRSADSATAEVLDVKPEQVTLVPDAPDAITSNAGWDTIKHENFLTEVIEKFKSAGIRTSIFIDTDLKLIEGAKKCGADRIELYTEQFASEFEKGNKEIVKAYTEAAKYAHELGLGINAGHDLSLDNIEFFKNEVPYLDEVSIGHALISEALYLGLENTIQMYIAKLK